MIWLIVVALLLAVWAGPGASASWDGAAGQGPEAARPEFISNEDGAMLSGLDRAEHLSDGAAGRYAELKAAAEADVVSWRWATWRAHSYEPAYFERHRVVRGQWLDAEPACPAGFFEYGFDAAGRVVVEREHVGCPEGRFGQTFYFHGPDGIASFRYHYLAGEDSPNESCLPKKDSPAVSWFPLGEHGVIAHYTAGGREDLYDYDERGRVTRVREGTQGGSYEIEYDDAGQIARVMSHSSDGSSYLEFEKVAEGDTLQARRDELLQGLTDAIIETLRSADPAEDVFAIVIHYYRQDTIPPYVSIGLASDRDHLLAEYGSQGDYMIWNPAEWPSTELAWLQLSLSPELTDVSQSVDQDIWQNELEAETHQFLLDLARSVRESDLPVQRAENFAVIVFNHESDDYLDQVEHQLTL